jgi:HTH-type transcriptional regulator/antitoxin HigA
MSTILADPAKMMEKGAPRVIRNDRELEAYTDALFELTSKANPSEAERQAIELLTLLIERYEEAHFSIPPADAATVLRFLMEQQGLAQRDLMPQFGSESAVSMFLSGQRRLTLDQVRRLSKRFRLPAGVFLTEAG